MTMSKSERIALFKEWMTTQKAKNGRKMLHGLGTAKQYMKHLEELNKLPIVSRNFGPTYDILGDAAAENFQNVVDSIKTDPGFDVLNNSVNYRGVYSAALEKFNDFLIWLSWTENTPSENELWECLVAGRIVKRSVQFLSWLPKQKSPYTHKLYSKKTAESYESALRCGRFRGFDFFAISDPEKLAIVRESLNATRDFQKLSKVDKHALSCALDAYGWFLRSI